MLRFSIMVICLFTISWAHSAPEGGAWTLDSPFFDVHMHYDKAATGNVTPAQVVTIMDAAGIIKSLVSSLPHDGTMKLYNQAPNRIVPELRFYKNPGDRLKWKDDPEVPKTIARQLSVAHPYSLIGEFHLYYDEEPTSVVNQVVAIAIRHNLFLHAHAQVEGLKKLLRAHPSAKVLWAHAGFVCAKICPPGVKNETPEPDVVKVMLDENPNLYVELSFRDSLSAANLTILNGTDKGRLPLSWRNLILAHPDRFMLGTDTYTEERWASYDVIVKEMRGWLADFPADVARKVAHENAQRLFY